MKKRFFGGSRSDSNLISRMRLSYIIPFIPILVLSVITCYNLWENNREYGSMIESTVKASAFSMDFKRDFDDESYLLIVGQRQPDDPKLDNLIDEAGQVVVDLDRLTNTPENSERLKQIRSYLDNLTSYVERIRDNLNHPDTYDENMHIWENDVQVGTSLLQETFYQYIYYEIKDLDKERVAQESASTRIITGTIVAYLVVIFLVLIVSYLFNRLLRQVRQEQIQLRKTEFLVLQSQINPHFLYNTLDAITWLAESGDRETVVKMVDSLSGFFRASLNKGKDIVTVSEELLHIRSYLEIQKIRYQDILEYEIRVPEDYGDVLIPKITIQPLVENALYHGIKNNRGGGRIEITANDHDGVLTICVCDNGIGMDKDRLRQVREAIRNNEPQSPDNSTPGTTGSYGLYNVNERIRLHFGDEYGITIESEPGVGTTSNIHLPLETKEKNTPVS